MLLVSGLVHVLTFVLTPGCPNLTDLSVLELAENLQKMRRIGLVKVGLGIKVVSIVVQVGS